MRNKFQPLRMRIWTVDLQVTESDPHARVAIITKSHLVESNTAYAQGGISAVWEESDTVEAHTRDTMVAGGYLNDEKVVEAVCREGPMRVEELIQWGTKFDKVINSDEYHLAKEVRKRLVSSWSKSLQTDSAFKAIIGY